MEQTFFANEALDDLQKLLKSKTIIQSDRTLLESMKNTLIRSVKFRLPDDGVLIDLNMNEYKKIIETYCPEFRLPFPTIALEYEITSKVSKFAEKVILVATESNGNIIIGTMIKDQLHETWNMGSHLFTGNRIDVRAHQLNPDQKLTEPQTQTIVSHLGYAFRVLLGFLAVVNCSNSTIVDDVKPSKSQQQKRTAMAKNPFFLYKVLTIDSKNPQNTNIFNSKEGSHNPRRAHVRRGHVRCYQTGLRIWVNSCMVGNPTVGILTKDYVVI